MRFKLILALLMLVSSALADEVDDQIAALKDPATGFEEKTEALNGLIQSNDSRAVEPLITCLNDENSVIRFSAAVGLGSFADPRAVDPLIDSLKNDKDVLTRKGAAYSLGKIGDPKALSPLKSAAANDESPQVRASATEAITSINAANPEDSPDSPFPTIAGVFALVIALVMRRVKR